MDGYSGSRSNTPVCNKLILNAGIFKHYAFALQIFTGSLKKTEKKEKKDIDIYVYISIRFLFSLNSHCMYIDNQIKITLLRRLQLQYMFLK